jgi:hypothetical protein
VTPIEHGLWLVSGLGAAVFAAAAGGRGPAFGGGALGFGAVFALLRGGWTPDPSFAGALTALAAGMLLYWPRARGAAGAAGGALAALLASDAAARGAPAVWTTLAAAAIPAAAAALAARDPRFASRRMREEGLLLVLILGIVLAAAPGIAAGWQSALALNIEGGAGAPGRAIPVWVAAVGAGSAALGGAWALWRRS